MANKSNNFQFEEMSVNAIRVIDSIRSRGETGSIRPLESRINAFYRAIGLPAVVKVLENEEDRDPLSVANIFPPDELNFKTYETDLSKRESVFRTRIDADEEATSFLYFQNKKPGDAMEKRGSGSLKPFVVAGDPIVKVFPQNRRVRGAFFSERQLQIGDVKYKRPLIETIIFMKLKGIGANNSATQQSVGASSTLSELIGQIGNSIQDAINAIPDRITEVSLNLQSATLETKRFAAPEEVPEENPESNVRDDENVGSSDKIDMSLQQQRAVNEAILSLFEFDDTFGDGVNNMKAGLLASEVLLGSATVEESGSEEANKEENEFRKESATKKIKSAHQTLDLALGTFSGISGIDILAVIGALIKLDVNYLIALVNDEAKDRLAEIKGNNVVNQARGISVKDALSRLEKEVSNYFEFINGELKADTHDKKSVNQRTKD